MRTMSINEVKTILLDTPPAARYLDLHWSLARSYHAWRELRARMAGAEMAVRQSDPDAADDYALLRDVAAIHAEQSLEANGVLAAIHLSKTEEAT